MKPQFWFLPLLFMLLACNTDETDLNSRNAKIRINYYTSICQGAFFALNCFHYQIDDEIGTDQWRTGPLTIPKFTYHTGNLYDLEVIITPNDISNCADDCAANNFQLIRISNEIAIDDFCRITPQPNKVCTEDYTPVCGCDGETYSNACVAERNGLSNWTLGECD